MGASHNQRVDVFIQNLCQIAARHFLGDRIFCPALFHERHEQRTRFSVNGDRRICLGNELLVEAALNSALGCDDADALVLRRLDGHLCARFYHADDREIDLFFDRIECQRTCCVAGDDDRLDLLGFQKVYDLAGITDDGFFDLEPYGTRAVSPKYTIRSSGRFRIISRTTVSPPTPESKTPIGACLSAFILSSIFHPALLFVMPNGVHFYIIYLNFYISFSFHDPG